MFFYVGANLSIVGVNTLNLRGFIGGKLNFYGGKNKDY